MCLRERAIASVEVWVVSVDCSPAVTGGKGEYRGPGAEKQREVMVGNNLVWLHICFPQRNR